MKQNEKGFTLVELIVAIGMAALLLSCVFGYMVSVSKNYQRNNQEVSVQNEAQSILTQLNSYMIDANVAIIADPAIDGNTPYVFILHSQYDATTTPAVTNYIGYVIRFVAGTGNEEGKLYFYKADSFTFVSDEAGGIDNQDAILSSLRGCVDASGSRSLMAEYVDKFYVSPCFSDQQSDNYVTVNVELKYPYSKTNYSASKNIFLRNRIIEPSAAANGATLAQSSSASNSTTSASESSEQIPAPSTVTPVTTAAPETQPSSMEADSNPYTPPEGAIKVADTYDSQTPISYDSSVSYMDFVFTRQDQWNIPAGQISFDGLGWETHAEFQCSSESGTNCTVKKLNDNYYVVTVAVNGSASALKNNFWSGSCKGVYKY